MGGPDQLHRPRSRTRPGGLSRRTVAAGALALAAAPAATLAQVGRVARIGYLSASDRTERNIDSVRDGLRELGYVEGRNLLLEPRFAADDYDRFPALLEELLTARLDVIVTAAAATLAALGYSGPTPIVFVFSGDPVDAGFVTSLRQPDRNMTGVSLMQLAISAKRIELLKDCVPSVRRVGVLVNPRHPGVQSERRATQEAADILKIEAAFYDVRSGTDFVAAFAAMEKDGCDGLAVLPDASTLSQRALIAESALRLGLPSVCGWKPFADAGGLLSYGPNLATGYARAAYYVDRILRGARARDLPVEQPTRFELIVNQKTATALGIKVPELVMFRATELIE
jgi:putative tryptophan/tyrosine transport system substrate-binding protein